MYGRIESYDSTIRQIFDDQAVDDEDVVSSDAIPYDGKSWITLFLKGDGNAGDVHIKFEFVISHDGTNYLDPLTAGDNDLVADFTSETEVWLQFTLPPCKDWKLKATGLATNGSDIDAHADMVASAAPQYLG